MTDRWHRTADLAGLPGMASRQAIQKYGPARDWISRRVRGHKQALEWLESSLPPETQAALRGEAAPAAESAPTPVLPADGRAAVLDARVALVTAFRRWRPAGRSLVPALKEWAALYNNGGGEVSAETRALVPRIAWNTLQRHCRALDKAGSMALLPGRGGRRSLIEIDPDFLAEAEAQMFERPHHCKARDILETLQARYPDRTMPGIHRETEPGGTLLISRIREAISTAEGETDHSLTAPAANVMAPQHTILVMGDVTWP